MKILLPKTGICILLTKTTAAQNEVALSYHNVHGLYFLAVVFVTTIVVFEFNNIPYSALTYRCLNLKQLFAYC